MNVDRNLEALRPLEDRPELPVVEELAPHVTVDQRALEAHFGDRSLELVRGLRRRGGRERCEGGETDRVRRDRNREVIVGAAGELIRLVRLELFGPRGAMRQNLDVDPTRIHVGQPLVAEVVQLGLDPGDRAVGRRLCGAREPH